MNFLVKPSLFALIFSALILSGKVAHAEGESERLYEVEVVVFVQDKFNRADAPQDESRENTPNDNAEKWGLRSNTAAARLQNLQQLQSRAEPHLLDESLPHLSRLRDSLVQSGRQIVRVSHWLQSPAIYQHAPLIALGEPNSPIFSGFVRVYKTSLIFIDLDLQWTDHRNSREMRAEFSEDWLFASRSKANGGAFSEVERRIDSAAQTYFISEKRRLKFDEAHYFDHPKFGAIVGVWPYEPPSETEQDAEDIEGVEEVGEVEASEES